LDIKKRGIIFEDVNNANFTAMLTNTEIKPIIQPNAITSARYEYSQMQKDFMYHLIDKMNKYMTKDHTLIKDVW